MRSQIANDINGARCFLGNETIERKCSPSQIINDVPVLMRLEAYNTLENSLQIQLKSEYSRAKNIYPSQIINDISGPVSFLRDKNICPQLVRQRPDFEQKLNLLHTQQLVTLPNPLMKSENSYTLQQFQLVRQRPDFAKKLSALRKSILLGDSVNSLERNSHSHDSLERNSHSHDTSGVTELPNSLSPLPLPNSLSPLPLPNSLSPLPLPNSLGPTRIWLRAQNESNCSPAGKVLCGSGSRISRFRALSILMFIFNTLRAQLILAWAQLLAIKLLAIKNFIVGLRTLSWATFSESIIKKFPAPIHFLVTEFGGIRQ